MFWPRIIYALSHICKLCLYLLLYDCFTLKYNKENLPSLKFALYFPVYTVKPV